LLDSLPTPLIDEFILIVALAARMGRGRLPTKNFI